MSSAPARRDPSNSVCGLIDARGTSHPRSSRDAEPGGPAARDWRLSRRFPEPSQRAQAEGRKATRSTETVRRARSTVSTCAPVVRRALSRSMVAINANRRQGISLQRPTSRRLILCVSETTLVYCSVKPSASRNASLTARGQTPRRRRWWVVNQSDDRAFEVKRLAR
jgi:hypothetical protein